MTHIFISYSKQDIVFARHVRSQLQAAGFTIWMDETRLAPSERWWPMIERNIRSCSALLVIMSPQAQESDWVEREILLGERLKKPIFPVLLAGEAWARLGNIQYEDLSADPKAALSDAFIERLKDFAPTFTGGEAPPQLPGAPITDTRPGPKFGSTTEGLSPSHTRTPVLAVVTGIAIILIAAIGGAAIWFATRPTPTASATMLQTQVAQATASRETPIATTALPTARPTATLTATATRTSTPMPSHTSTPSLSPPSTQPVSGIDQAKTLRAQGFTQTATLWTRTPTSTSTATANETTTLAANLTLLAATDTQQTNLNQSATATLWTPTITPTFTPSSTSTPTLTPTPSDTPIPAVTTNKQWMPQIKVFNDVPMVLVPPGCFTMGSSDIKDAPLNKFCFDTPFWLDEFLVTQSQFKAFKGQAANNSFFGGNQRPVDSITWVEARTYCEQNRSGRLPTEVEYEYAARGPDNLVFPWGNTFNSNDVVFAGNSGNQSANVGSKADGKSWVGAFDMVGDVWEWTSSQYKPYPYDPTDGREDTGDVTAGRVLRGGSWKIGSDLRAAIRQVNKPSDGFADDGLRCARSF